MTALLSKLERDRQNLNHKVDKCIDSQADKSGLLSLSLTFIYFFKQKRQQCVQLFVHLSQVSGRVFTVSSSRSMHLIEWSVFRIRWCVYVRVCVHTCTRSSVSRASPSPE